MEHGCRNTAPPAAPSSVPVNVHGVERFELPEQGAGTFRTHDAAGVPVVSTTHAIRDALHRDYRVEDKHIFLHR
jgi:hypothetical protein